MGLADLNDINHSYPKKTSFVTTGHVVHCGPTFHATLQCSSCLTASSAQAMKWKGHRAPYHWLQKAAVLTQVCSHVLALVLDKGKMVGEER